MINCELLALSGDNGCNSGIPLPVRYTPLVATQRCPVFKRLTLRCIGFNGNITLAVVNLPFVVPYLLAGWLRFIHIGT